MTTRRLPDEHVYHADGIATRWGGAQGCTRCPLPKTHPVHIAPPDNPIAEQEERRLGQHDPPEDS